MPPRAVNFKAGSIVYFEGDKANSVFLLKDGKVNLAIGNIQSGDEDVVSLNPGEFFGVKSGMISFPREETAKVVSNSVILEFPVSDFENLISKNTQIIIKMLKVFSNQLRKIHRQVQSMVSETTNSINPSEDLFVIGEYYLKNRNYSHALTVYNRYLKHYSNQSLAKKANERIKMAQSALDAYGDGGGPVPMLDQALSSTPSNMTVKEDKSEPSIGAGLGNETTEGEKVYAKAVNLMGQQKFVDAYGLFKQIQTNSNQKLSLASTYEMGKCLFSVGKYLECIKHYNQFLNLNPSYEEVNDIKYMIGVSYAKSGDISNAKKILTDVVTTTGPTDPVNRKATKALKELG